MNGALTNRLSSLRHPALDPDGTICRTGASSAEEAGASPAPPDLVVPTLSELGRMLDEARGKESARGG
jgi:hypothetical protein